MIGLIFGETDFPKYIYKKIKDYNLLITRISRGIAVGSELQYADELTLGRSLQQRQVFDLAQ